MKLREVVDPQFVSRLQNLELIARLIVRGFITGLHRSPNKGYSVEFSQYRSYTEGDEIKDVDWKVFGRSDKLVVKQYEEETNLSCHIILDVSSSMASNSGPISKLQYGVHLTAALTLLMLYQRDSVGLALVNDGIVEYMPPRSGMSNFYAILNCLENLSASGKTDLQEGFRDLASRVKKRSLIIVISDLLGDPRAIINTIKNIRFRKHEVIVLDLWDRAEEDFPYKGRIAFTDIETGKVVRVQAEAIKEQYKKTIEDIRQTYRQELIASCVDYVSMPTREAYTDALYSYLKKRQRLR